MVSFLTNFKINNTHEIINASYSVLYTQIRIMVKKELIAIGLSFILVLSLAGIFAVSAYAITGYMDAPSDIIQKEAIVSTSEIIAA